MIKNILKILSQVFRVHIPQLAQYQNNFALSNLFEAKGY